MKIQLILLIGLLIWTGACAPTGDPDGSQLSDHHFPSQNYHYASPDTALVKKSATIYLPVYSDIYIMSGQRSLLLTTTVSVRNTSTTDSLFVSFVNYFDSEGQLIRRYIEGEPLLLGPLASAEFIVEYREEKGGAGANFLVGWSSYNEKVKPLVQAIMIGASGNQGISFTTEGFPVE